MEFQVEGAAGVRGDRRGEPDPGKPLSCSSTAPAWITASGRCKAAGSPITDGAFSPSICPATAVRRAAARRASARSPTGRPSCRRAGRPGGHGRPFDGRADRAEKRGASSRAVSRSALIGVGEKMAVHPGSPRRRKAGHPEAVDMVSLWGLGGPATLRRHPDAGTMDAGRRRKGCWSGRRRARCTPIWPLATPMRGRGGCRQASSAPPCLRSASATDDAGEVGPGARQARFSARKQRDPGSGHMLTIERPDETLAALKNDGLRS